MQLFTCCLLVLSLATVVLTAPVRARRENVVSFLTDALEKTRTTEKMIPARITGNGNAPSYLVADDDSEDTSDAKSAEKDGVKDAVEDLDSHEILIPSAVEKHKAPRKPGAGTGGVVLTNTSRREVPDPGSREQSGPQRASREWTDAHSDEDVMLATHGVEGSPGGQRKAGRGDERIGPGGSRELRDSLEDNGRTAALDTDHDETREDSSEPRPPELGPSSSLVPAGIQSS